MINEENIPFDTVNRDTIHKLVHEFYALVLEDEMVGPYFVKALGSDLTNGKWHEHLHTLDDFWLLMMIGKPGYKGDPFPPHAFLGPIYIETFEQWLKLFKQTTQKYFIPSIADKFYKKAEIMAEQFIENLGLNDEDDDD